jgi:hypothetical protein
MAEAYILDETPQKLSTYIDIPWLQDGDFFYMQKLAETIKAFSGIQWSEY